MQTHTCFLLSYVKFGDNDAFLHCFSADAGYQSFFAKGLYLNKNKKKPYLFPLSLLAISVVKTGASKKIPTVSKLELASEYVEVKDVRMQSIVFFAAEFLHQILREEQRNPVAFQAVSQFREDIKKNNFNAHINLLVKFLGISGVAPLTNAYKFLNPEAGNFTHEIAHPIFTEDISRIWKTFLMAEDIGEISLTRDNRNSFLDSLLIYYHQHFTGFYTPHSLAVLRQIFD